ncbi:hypothetical protein HDU87_005857 [Geranomyces variabilis]|uniref:Post-SET domain-containing protein n=1 Tax=Geranomyces variabilis TaxID=109894 RepID=A0AAD5TGB1_9FUNG|nr:hypothetical protein HDU87_005857 [Geranomyces variabilis]
MLSPPPPPPTRQRESPQRQPLYDNDKPWAPAAAQPVEQKEQLQEHDALATHPPAAQQPPTTLSKPSLSPASPASPPIAAPLLDPHYAALNSLAIKSHPPKSFWLASHPIHGTCILSTAREAALTCSADEAAHHEALVHPAMLLHPRPRRVLVVGGIVEAAVRESLRHFLVPNVTWAAEEDTAWRETGINHMPKSYRFDDPLGRLRIEHIRGPDYMRIATMKKDLYDVVVIVDDAGLPPPPGVDATKATWTGIVSGASRGRVLETAQAALNPGGILALNCGTDPAALGEDRRHARRFFPRVFYASRYVASAKGVVSYLFATRSDAPPDPASLHPAYIDSRLARTTTGELSSYDGATHVHMFAIPKDVRAALESADREARQRMRFQIVVGATPAAYIHAPFEFPPLPDVPARGEMVVREMYGCTEAALAVDSVEKALRDAIAVSGGGAVLNVDAKSGPQMVNFTGVPESVSSVSVVAMTLGGGSIAVHAWPAYQYALVSIADFYNSTARQDTAEYLFAAFEATKSTGTSNPIGSLDRLHPGPRLTHIAYAAQHPDSTHLTERRTTPRPGIYATAKIPRGYTIFVSPVDPSQLRTRAELPAAGGPAWRVVDAASPARRGAQVEDDVFVVPAVHGRSGGERRWQVAHSCEPSLWVDGYDTVVARRDIEVHEELSLDYGTVYSDPEALHIEPCTCGARTCRGRVTGDDWKLAAVRGQYGLARFLPHIQKKILGERTGGRSGRGKSALAEL